MSKFTIGSKDILYFLCFYLLRSMLRIKNFSLLFKIMFLTFNIRVVSVNKFNIKIKMLSR